MFLPHPRVKVSIVGSLRDREVACSASDRQGSNFESCVWRTVSSQSSHHPQEVLLAQFSLYVHKGGLKPDSFHFIFILRPLEICLLLMYIVLTLVVLGLYIIWFQASFSRNKMALKLIEIACKIILFCANFHKYKYFLTFEAVHCVSKSSLK